MMQITCPAELPPDRKIIVATPDGQRMAIQVPVGVNPGQSIQIQIPPRATPATQTLEILVPQGVAPGQQIRIQGPTGQSLQIVIPPGVYPGMKMQVQVPAAGPSTPQPPPTATGAAPEAAPADDGAGVEAKEEDVKPEVPEDADEEDDSAESEALAEASRKRAQEAAIAEAEAEAERQAAAAEEERLAKEEADAEAARTAALPEGEKLQLVVSALRAVSVEASKAADEASAAVAEAEAVAEEAAASAEEAQKSEDVAPEPVAQSRNAARQAASKAEAAAVAAAASKDAAEQVAAAIEAASAATTPEEAEGLAAAARGAASTARVENFKAHAAVKHAKKAAAAAKSYLESAEAIAFAGASEARRACVEAVISVLCAEIAMESTAEHAAELAEQAAEKYLSQDVGGNKPMKIAEVKRAANRCDTCNDFTTEKETRGGKCLHCFRNPDYMDPITLKPKSLGFYYKEEMVRETALEKLQLAYAETPLSLNAAKLSKEIDDAAESSVNIMYLHQARTKLRALEQQAEAAKVLEKAVKAAERYPSNHTRKGLAEAWAEGARKGVAMGVLQDAQKKLRVLEKTDAFEAEAALEWLSTEAKGLDADMLTDAAKAAEAKARGKLDVTNTALREARKALKEARDKHDELESAASNLLLLAAPRPIDEWGLLERASMQARRWCRPP